MTAVDETFTSLVGRLNRASVDKHFDAYADVDWDSPELAVDPADPRWELTSIDVITKTPWYAGLPPETRAEVGLYRLATTMRIGWEFENLLQRGLLLHAFHLRNGRPEFRYLHHEIVEESQHTMMFQEFVNRSGLDARGIPRFYRWTTPFIVPLAKWFPALFFLFVLGGEDPADHLQRIYLKGSPTHPLAERIMRIHITEEARHLSFAREYLRTQVPRLGPVRRFLLAVVAPALMGRMTRMMVDPSPRLIRRYGLPRRQLRAAKRTPEHKQIRRDSIAKTRRLCAELGLMTRVTRPIWRLYGVGEA
jgi:hypothetical protein